ncbi:MAG: CDGSH iron-sulfur domain-containing protein [Candidatus Bathyarchaeia archaeon]|jgi:CDGSH-type Zn-finger protein
MKVKIKENGPILLESNGQAKITQNGQQKPIQGSIIAICRCGQSKNQPFCDGSYAKANFKADSSEIDI